MSQDNTFPKKYKTKLPETFEEEVGSMSEDDLRKRILTCEGHLYEIEKEKEADEKLTAARALVKELSAPYNETKLVETAKIKYLCYVLETRGARV